MYKAIDFFCGGGGMTHGLRQAGIEVIAGVDFDIDAQETYEFNNPGSVFINTDIKHLRSNERLKLLHKMLFFTSHNEETRKACTS